MYVWSAIVLILSAVFLVSGGICLVRTYKLIRHFRAPVALPQTLKEETVFKVAPLPTFQSYRNIQLLLLLSQAVWLVFDAAVWGNIYESLQTILICAPLLFLASSAGVWTRLCDDKRRRSVLMTDGLDRRSLVPARLHPGKGLRYLLASARLARLEGGKKYWIRSDNPHANAEVAGYVFQVPKKTTKWLRGDTSVSFITEADLSIIGAGRPPYRTADALNTSSI